MLRQTHAARVDKQIERGQSDSSQPLLFVMIHKVVFDHCFLFGQAKINKSKCLEGYEWTNQSKMN
jgi:hypothetical protein